jgi:hypothetical protein
MAYEYSGFASKWRFATAENFLKIRYFPINPPGLSLQAAQALIG